MNIFSEWVWRFLGIVIESLPFIIIGSAVAAIIQFYISEQVIKKCIPKIKILGYLVAVVCGIFFPICECAIIPIARSLMKKGLPVGVGVSFMLAVPIINPLVILSTYYAFEDNMFIVIGRIIGGALIALLVGLLIGTIYSKKSNELIFKDTNIDIKCDCCNISNRFATRKRDKFISLINHGSSEFLTISVYFIIGAFLSSIFGVVVQDEFLQKIYANNVLGILFMIAISFLLSLCSEADAFVVKDLLDNFGQGAILAFLVMGPMMDLKNLFLALSVFKAKFVATLTLLIVFLITIGGIIISFF